MLLSGSFIVSGKCLAKVKHIGEQNYTAKISSEAKYVKKVNSEIMLSLNKIIKFLSFAIVPIGILLFFNQLKISGGNIEEASDGVIWKFFEEKIVKDYLRDIE